MSQRGLTHAMHKLYGERKLHGVPCDILVIVVNKAVQDAIGLSKGGGEMHGEQGVGMVLEKALQTEEGDEQRVAAVGALKRYVGVLLLHQPLDSVLVPVEARVH